VTVSAADFVSLDFSGATGQRNADGSLPTINFLKLAAGSNLIDKGVDVGLPYSGSAPDLGAYEYSATTPPADTQAPTAPTSLTATTISASQINLSWTASTDNVGVVGYNVYRDGVKIGTPASTTYSSTGLTAATTYSYSVTAFDAAGNTSAPSTSATARTAPTPDTTPPTVSIASPTGGTVSNTVAVSVNAADNVGVARVDLRVNGATAATTNLAPYQFAWNSTTVPNGPVALTAVAYDAAGNSTTSAAIALSVLNGPPPDTTPPTVSIASPTGGTVSNTVAVSVNAADNVGVTRVDLRVNGATAASTNAAPYQFAWNSTTVPNGSVALTAVAYDAAGNSTTSAAIALSVLNAPPPDTTPPTVSIASPTGGTVSNVVAVSVNAADNVGVTRVELRVNGVTVGSGTASPWQFSWDSRTVADGAVRLAAIAYDAAGNSTESLTVTVTASNASGNGTTLPSLDFINPANGAFVSGPTPIKTIASDTRTSASITQKLYVDGVLKTIVKSNYLAYRWNASNVASGVHTILVTATDDAGNSTTKQVQVTRK
jgi:chitinase